MQRHTSTAIPVLAGMLGAAGLLALAACGGGGGGSATTTGGGQGPVVTMPPPEPFDTIKTSWRRSHDGEPASRVADYLQTYASAPSAGLVRFASPPVVRVDERASDRERAIAAHAVALINRALPYDQHLIIGEDAPAGDGANWREGIPHVPDGEIFVYFLPGRTNAFPNYSAAVAHHRMELEYDADQERLERKGVRAGATEMESAYFRVRPDHLAVDVLVHELLHTMGFAYAHPDRDRFSPSVMNSTSIRPDGSLPSIDAAGLQALYLRLGEETEPEDLSISSLGAWSRETIHLRGGLGNIAFGVRHSNGASMPWTAGAEPSTALEDNSRLSGTTTWNGGLLGFTPDLEVVGGNAELSVDLSTMNGRAEFTELQSWAAGAVPGELGTGSQWNTGHLGYTITIAGNYLRTTGGDGGTVNGQFYGAGHEGVAGSLEREDLTAAFGAARD